MKGDKYFWTQHSLYKIRNYGLSRQRIKRVIRHPQRVEEAIIPSMIGAMQPAGGKKYSEIWAMYQIVKSKLRIITVWRYPGKSPIRNPIPLEILEEIKSII